MPELSAEDPGSALWVFGYGSLLWNPGFAWSERYTARLDGYHRAFCRYSFRHRGTPESPGLVIGLREGGACLGMVYRIADGAYAEAMAYLDGREGAGYHRLAHAVHLAGPTPCTVTAWVYIPNTEHPSYFGRQDPAHIATLVAKGQGESGAAIDYLRALIAQLKHMGVEEAELSDVLQRAERLRSAATPHPATGAPSRVG